MPPSTDNGKDGGWPNDPSDEDLENLYIAFWRIGRHYNFDIKKTPEGQRYAEFFNRPRLTRLLRLAISGQCDDLLYVALQTPLNATTTNGGAALQMWWSHVAWLKRSLVSCVDGWPDDIQIARKSINLRELLSFLPKTMNPSAQISASDIANTIRMAGGITIEWLTGHQPTAGFAVAPSKTTEHQVPLAEFSAEHVSEYTNLHAGLLNIPGMCFGARVKEEVVYLDVSLVVEEITTAAALAGDADQFAIRCLHESHSIPTEEAATASQIEQEKSSERYLTLRSTIEQSANRPAVTRERCQFLLTLTDVQKVRILLGRPVAEAGEVTGIERQFVRAHLTPEETQLLWSCI